MSHRGDASKNTGVPVSGEKTRDKIDRVRSTVRTSQGGQPDKTDQQEKTDKTAKVEKTSQTEDKTEKPTKPKQKSVAFNLASPVSPLGMKRGSGEPVGSNITSSSSSSGSLTGRLSTGALKSGSNSGELTVSGGSSPSGVVDSPKSRERKGSKTGYIKTVSGQLIPYSGNVGSSGGGSSASVCTSKIPPMGNIGKPAMLSNITTKTDVLGRGGNYGHGSVVRGSPKSSEVRLSGNMPPPGKYDSCSAMTKAMMNMDLEEMKSTGNEKYKKGEFSEALKFYDHAIAMSPKNAACRSNRAAALIAMGRLGEAIRECEEAVRLDPTYSRAHQRLASLYLRLGQIENARNHFHFTGDLPDPLELQKLQSVERHLSLCEEFWKLKDWKSVLRECDGAILSGADSSLPLIALKAEALLRLQRMDEADSTLSSLSKLELLAPFGFQTKFLGMLSSSLIDLVRAQVDMAFGRFENARSAAERARTSDPQNQEAARVLAIVKSVCRARTRGNELFTSTKYADACLAYGEGLRSDPFNPVLYCNRAACYAKLGQWEKSIEDCNEALKIKPNYTKALLRRASSYGNLERWDKSIQDYEALKREHPNDADISEALFRAYVALKSSRCEDAQDLNFGEAVEKVSGIDQFKSAISVPGVTVVHFMSATDQQCIHLAPFVNTLCSRNPSLKFLKVDVNESVEIAESENVRIVPTFKLYKNGYSVKEMICPSNQILESSVRHYAL